MAYEYDVFLSYTRSGGCGGWVRDIFHPRLVDELQNAGVPEPRVFVDWQQKTGVPWPDNIAHALLHSTLMVSILCPPYFHSPWCLAEWETMRARERRLGLGKRGKPVLILPVTFADGDSFPASARRYLHWNMSDWGYALPPTAFFSSELGLSFLREMRRFATELVTDHLDNAPEWERGWPVRRPTPMQPPRSPVPRLGKGPQ